MKELEKRIEELKEKAMKDLRQMVIDSINCLRSCVEDDAKHVAIYEAHGSTYYMGRIDGYQKAIELLEYVLEQTNYNKETVTVIGAKFDPKKMHIYDVKTKGKHPVHLIEGGEYLTEDERVLDESSDMGWFWLNQKDYEYFKAHCEEIKF